MVKNKLNIILGIATLFLMFVSSSCKKKDELEIDGSGMVKMQVKVEASDFTNSLANAKMASTFSYTPSQTYSIDYDKDNILFAELEPLSYDINNKIVSSRLLASNSANTPPNTHAIDDGDVYRLMVFKSDGEWEATRDYYRGSESETEAIILSRNTAYIFISYSLNSTRKDSINNILNVLPNGTTRTLANTSIKLEGNQDLLFFKKQITTPNSDAGFLTILLKHQFNLVRTTVNVAESGYSMATTLAGNILSKTNSITLGFAKPSSSNDVDSYTVSRSPLNNSQALSFQYGAAPGSIISNTLAVSNTCIVNVANGESIIQINSLKIGDVSSSSTISPFLSGVTMVPGGQYNLSIKMVPKDSLYTLDGKPVARINGIVWMRHNLEADYNSNPDVPGPAIQGAYYQWGESFSILSGTATSVAGYNSNFVRYPPTDPNWFSRWNSGTDENPIRGSADPCPNGFRLPTKLEYQNLILNTTSYQVTGSNGSSQFNNAMQLKSKRKASVRLTFPAQGYVGEGTAGDLGSSPHSISQRGASAYTKSSSYNITGIEKNGNKDYIKMEYILLQGLTNASMFIGPGGGKASAVAVCHPVRCVAIGVNRGININDREIDNNDAGNVGF